MHRYNTRSAQAQISTIKSRRLQEKALMKSSPAKKVQSQTKQTQAKRNYKKNDSSDDSTSEDDKSEDDKSEDEEDNMSEDDDDFIVKDNGKQFDQREFQSLLAKLYPSKFIRDKLHESKELEESNVQKSKVQKLKVQKSNVQKSKVHKSKITNHTSLKHNKHKKPYSRYERESAPSPIDCSTPIVEEGPNKMSKFNIIFAISPTSLNNQVPKKIEDYEEYHSSDDPDYDPQQEENELMDEDDSEEYSDDGYDILSCDASEDCCDCNEHTEKTVKYLNWKERKEEHVNKKLKYKNTLQFRDLLQQKNVMNDLNYFQEKMSLEEQQMVLKQMEEIKSIIDIEKPYRLALLASPIPSRFKASAYNKLSTLKNMEPGCSEYNKVKQWVDDFMRIPFNKINHLPVCIEDGIDKCHDFMAEAKNTLDKAVYGLNDVKLQVMQMVGQWITNPDAIGNSVAIEGPPGTGKTTLVKEGISKILNREFVFIPLGGATDSSCLEGHSYTYEGSACGLIVKQLIQCQSMNPIIYFDELDKISDTPKGEEIVGILTHLTDTSQNSSFHDKYFAEFDFDLSKCVFFFSYNDRNKVNKILLDRMHCIMTKGYALEQKTIIAKDYLLPTIRKQVKFNDSDIIIPHETTEYIINNHTHKEDGVRNLKRCLEIIHTKLNLYRLMKPNTNLFESDMDIKVEFPITVTPHIVDKLIKKQSETGAWQNMYS